MLETEFVRFLLYQVLLQ